MSKILWQKSIIPEPSSPATTLNDPTYRQNVESVRAYPTASSDLAIPDPKAFRSMSRASVFLSHICMDAKTALAPYLLKSPFSVGVYCAVENGPIDAPSTAKIVEQKNPAAFAELYRKFRNPKMYLKQLPNLVPAQMGISMGLQGPMNVYTHSAAASLHALEQAEWDLQEGVIDAALVCSAHAFDDFLVLKRTRASDLRCLNEGAAALLLANDGTRTEWARKVSTDSKQFYGIADPLINLTKEKNHVAN